MVRIPSSEKGKFGAFSHNLAPVSLDDELFFIDKKGNKVIGGCLLYTSSCFPRLRILRNFRFPRSSEKNCRIGFICCSESIDDVENTSL